ncbi:mediator complex, subunit Med20 [Tuber indicum]|nr:mediator complex, subunit Med20 [Tuber indicum]
MPVTGIYWINTPLTTPPQNMVPLLADCLGKRHQPLFAGKWALEHRLLRETIPSSTTSANTSSQSNNHTSHSQSSQPQPPAGGNYMQYLDLPYLPGKLIVLTPSAIVTLDREFDLLVRSKLSALWSLRQTLRGEGLAYEVDDFKVRIANILQGEVWKGVLVEVEYAPCSLLAVAEGVIRGFVEGLGWPAGRFTFVGKGGGRRVEGEEWSVLDTGRQYCEVLRMGWGG